MRHGNKQKKIRKKKILRRKRMIRRKDKVLKIILKNLDGMKEKLVGKLLILIVFKH
jgi:hypothetical protein